MTPPGWYADPQDASRLRWWDGLAWTAQVTAPAVPAAAIVDPQVVAKSQREMSDLQAQVVRLRAEAQQLRQSIVQTSDVMLLQEVGVYEYSHPLDDSAQYKGKLEEIEAAYKQCVRDGSAVSSTKKWAINGSDKDGAKMVADFSKLILRAYNNEADNIVRTLRPYSVEAALTRLDKLRTSIAKLGASMKLAITDHYHVWRVKEIQITADFQAKLAEEREAERDRRARLREERKAQREFEAEQRRLEKERAHYLNKAQALLENGDVAGAADARTHVEELQRALQGVIDRAANIRAGYVYVISNIGAFGERVVKIGLTRRLQPLDRVRELGGASVPFRFDVHAIIFSDDAVSLETALHREFASRRVNMVNTRREFFYVTVEEVKDVLHRMQGSLLQYVDVAEALEWHQSENLRRGLAPGSPLLVDDYDEDDEDDDEDDED